MAMTNVEFWMQAMNRIAELEEAYDATNIQQVGVIKEMKKDLERFWDWSLTAIEVDEILLKIGDNPPCQHSAGHRVDMNGNAVCRNCGKPVEF